jgi:23S rRNA (guanosine2251-2'-O)-methyltransferase
MSGEETIIGLHAVAAALKGDPGNVLGIWVDRRRRDSRMGALLEEARRRGVSVQPLERAELDRLSEGGNHQGVVARLGRAPAVLDEHQLLERLARTREPPLVLVLDGVQDPHNLGACLRSADAAGVHAVVAPADRAVGLTPVVRKVACGAADTVPFVRVTNLARTLRRLQTEGMWLVGADGEAGVSLYDTDLAGPVAIVLGAEGRGLRRLTRDVCDRLAAIPLVGRVESLNVSVAAGVFLFEARRQRR